MDAVHTPEAATPAVVHVHHVEAGAASDPIVFTVGEISANERKFCDVLTRVCQGRGGKLSDLYEPGGLQAVMEAIRAQLGDDIPLWILQGIENVFTYGIQRIDRLLGYMDRDRLQQRTWQERYMLYYLLYHIAAYQEGNLLLSNHRVQLDACLDLLLDQPMLLERLVKQIQASRIKAVFSVEAQGVAVCLRAFWRDCLNGSVRRLAPLLELLMRLGCDVNGQYFDNGNTLLHVVVAHPSFAPIPLFGGSPVDMERRAVLIGLVRTMINVYGADPLVPNGDDQTVLAYAREIGVANPEFVALLDEARITELAIDGVARELAAAVLRPTPPFPNFRITEDDWQNIDANLVRLGEGTFGHS